MMTLADTLRNLMKTNIVRFTFRKKDGTIRHAIGTRNLNLADDFLGEKVSRPCNAEQPNAYFDLEKGAWRSYVPSNIISIDDIIPTFPTLSRIAEMVLGSQEPTTTTEKREIPIGNGKVGIGVSANSDTDEKNEPMDIFSGIGGGIAIPIGIGKVGKPTNEPNGIALPLNGVGGGDMTIDDFAKLIAKYVVAELTNRLTD